MPATSERPVPGGVGATAGTARGKTPDDVFEFAKVYNTFSNRKPLVAVPTSYNKTTEDELINWRTGRQIIGGRFKEVLSGKRRMGSPCEHSKEFTPVSMQDPPPQGLPVQSLVLTPQVAPSQPSSQLQI